MNPEGSSGNLFSGSISPKASAAFRGTFCTCPACMEKMAAGFLEESGDWRYSMVMPNGKIMGITNGDGSGKVEFCIQCHIVAERDSMFFLPEEYRK